LVFTIYKQIMIWQHFLSGNMLHVGGQVLLNLFYQRWQLALNIEMDTVLPYEATTKTQER